MTANLACVTCRNVISECMTRSLGLYKCEPATSSDFAHAVLGKFVHHLAQSWLFAAFHYQGHDSPRFGLISSTWKTFAPRS